VRREEGGGGGGGRGADTELKTKTPHVNVGNKIYPRICLHTAMASKQIYDTK